MVKKVKNKQALIWKMDIIINNLIHQKWATYILLINSKMRYTKYAIYMVSLRKLNAKNQRITVKNKKTPTLIHNLLTILIEYTEPPVPKKKLTLKPKYINLIS